MCGLTMVSTTLLYGSIISPIFIEPSVTNSAVLEFIGSDSFKANTAPMFQELERYNSRSPGERVPKPVNFHASSGSQRGMEVIANYELVPRAAVDPMALDDASKVPQYSYSPKFSLRLDPRYLAAYVAVMALLATAAFYIVGTSREGQRREDNLLDTLQARYLSEMDGGNAQPETSELLVRVLERFHAFARQIVVRYDGRDAMFFKDEYDVQDALRAILNLHYLDVRPEEWAPSYAGKSSRMDFLVNDGKIVVEAKMTRKNLRDKEVGDQLLIDIGRYHIHPSCQVLICFIYDPDGLLSNPHALIADLQQVGQEKGLQVRIVVSPLH